MTNHSVGNSITIISMLHLNIRSIPDHLQMTYQNRYPYKLGYKVFLNPEKINLKNEYKLKRKCLISDLRNMEINYYSNELEINKVDI